MNKIVTVFKFFVYFFSNIPSSLPSGEESIEDLPVDPV